ncbi:MAG: hypothetical protein GX569_15450 [Candidatus Riflebacteria bacterium]|nr:hypothetical protein [Candidatus Riflebacteria bacterium]
MLRIAVLIFYIYVLFSNEMSFADDDLIFVLMITALVLPAMAVGFYYMRAESGGVDSLLQLAGRAERAAEEDLAAFRIKYLAARESLYTAGMFFWLSLVLVLAKERYLVSSNNLDYQLVLAGMIPVICLSVYEDALYLVLKIKAGMQTRLPVEYDLWLSWLNCVMLCVLAVMHALPYYDSNLGVAVFGAMALVATLYAAGVYFARYRKAHKRGGNA